MKINSILKKLNMKIVNFNHHVEQITDDSRNCLFNSVFIAVKGERKNGNNFIEQAINNGAKTIITDTIIMEYPHINYVYVNNPKRVLALMLRIFYKNISKKINLIGVIGTNGKTSVSTLGYDFFNYVDKKAMLIGSNGIFYQGIKVKTNNTTPAITTIYEYLYKALTLGIRYIFMEVSSISVSELRYLGLTFKVLIYTNFSEDHLDYHKNMDVYFYEKIIPFLKLKNGVAIMNADDNKVESIIKHVDSRVVTYGIKKGDYLAMDSTITNDGISFIYNNIIFKSKMLGGFNIYNILAILVLIDYYKIDLKQYIEFLSNYLGVLGRMQKVEYNKMIIIDYAHTEEAIKQAIYEVLNICKDRLFIVVGCGGNREKEKREKIGKFLDCFSDNLILTSDNPRYEEPLEIINDILRGMNNKPIIIENRKEAIEYALNMLQENDCLLILGKGIEDYIDIKGVKYPYSDLEVCNAWIRSH